MLFLQGEPDHFKKYEPAPYITPAARSPSPAPDAAKASPAKKGKGKERTGTTPEPPPMVCFFKHLMICIIE